MQEPRRQGDSSDDRSTGNTNQPQKQSPGVKSIFTSPVAAALLTAASSLVLFTFNQVKTIDARLDELEKEARILLRPDGTAVASKEALEAYFGLQAVRQRILNLEDKLHFHSTTEPY